MNRRFITYLQLKKTPKNPTEKEKVSYLSCPISWVCWTQTQEADVMWPSCRSADKTGLHRHCGLLLRKLYWCPQLLLYVCWESNGSFKKTTLCAFVHACAWLHVVIICVSRRGSQSTAVAFPRQLFNLGVSNSASAQFRFVKSICVIEFTTYWSFLWSKGITSLIITQWAEI